MIKKMMIVALLLIVLFAIAPFLSALAASGIASALDCALDEGSIRPCMLGGVNIGGALYTMFVIGWLGLMTIPSAFLALMVWLAAALVLYVLHRRRRAA